MTPRKERSSADIQWTMLELPDGSQERACSVSDAALYLEVSAGAIITILDRTRTRRYEPGGKTHKKWVLEKDLKALKVAHPDREFSAEQLLEQAYTLLSAQEQQPDVQKWLENYKKWLQ